VVKTRVEAKGGKKEMKEGNEKRRLAMFEDSWRKQKRFMIAICSTFKGGEMEGVRSTVGLLDVWLLPLLSIQSKAIKVCTRMSLSRSFDLLTKLTTVNDFSTHQKRPTVRILHPFCPPSQKLFKSPQHVADGKISRFASLECLQVLGTNTQKQRTKHSQ
jgi:hypothetical protein